MQYHAELGVDVLPLQILGGDAVDADGTVLDFVEPHQQVHQGGFSGAGGAYNGDFLAGFGLCGKVVDDGFPGAGVAKFHMVKFHIPLGFVQTSGFAAFVLHLFPFQKFEHPLSGGSAGLQRLDGLGDLGQGLGEVAHIHHKGDNHLKAALVVHGQHRPHHTDGHIAEVADEGH